MSNFSNISFSTNLKDRQGTLLLAVPWKSMGEVNINGRSYFPGEGDLMVLPPGMNFSGNFRSPEEGWRMYAAIGIDLVMELPSPFDTDLVSKARECPVPHAPEDELKAIEEIYGLLRRTRLSDDSPYCDEVCKSLTFALLYRLGNIYAIQEEAVDDSGVTEGSAGTASRPGAGRNESFSDRFFALLSQHYRHERKIEFYADCMSVTPRYLSRAIRKISGRTAREWIDEAVLLEIKNLLHTSDMTVLEISEALNFCSPSAFVQYFKQHCGTTPHRYRRSGKW